MILRLLLETDDGARIVSSERAIAEPLQAADLFSALAQHLESGEPHGQDNDG